MTPLPKIKKDCEKDQAGARVVVTDVLIFCDRCDGFHKTHAYQGNGGIWIRIESFDAFVAEEKHRLRELRGGIA